jgi:cytochrome P450
MDVVLKETIRRSYEPRLWWLLHVSRRLKFSKAFNFVATETLDFINKYRRQLLGHDENGSKVDDPQRNGDGSKVENNANNILSLLIRAQDEEGSMSDEELVQETGTMIGAGHETTSKKSRGMLCFFFSCSNLFDDCFDIGNTICWALCLLALHPEKQKKLQQEVDSILGIATEVSYDNIKALRYTTAVFYETLRLYPTVRNELRN